MEIPTNLPFPDISKSRTEHVSVFYGLMSVIIQNKNRRDMGNPNLTLQTVYISLIPKHEKLLGKKHIMCAVFTRNKTKHFEF